MKNTTKITGLILAAFISGSAFATDSGSTLVEPDKTYFDEVVVGEISQAERIQEVYIAPLVTDNLVIHEPSANYRRPHQDFVLEADELQAMQDMYHEVLEDRFTDENLVVVDSIGENTLVVTAELTELFPVAPKDDPRNRRITDDYYTEGAGDASITLTISLNGETLMAANDRRQMGHRWQENDRFHNKIEFRRVLNSWASSLLKQITT